MKRDAIPRCVLDASALMALINNEPGSAFVEEYTEDACISSINFTEVLSKMLEYAVPVEAAQAALNSFNLKIFPFDHSQIVGVSLLRIFTKQYGLSLADRICLNLGKTLKLPIITTDQIWKKLKSPDFNVVLVKR